jgi:hypothetical protein
MIGHVFLCLLNPCGLWSVMHFSANGIVVACGPVICHVFVCLLNRCCLWSGIQQAQKYMTDHRQLRFNKHINTWHIIGHNDSTSWQIHDRSQPTRIPLADKNCMLVGSLWPVIGHVFVCFLNHCGLLSVMYLCACWIVVACDRSCMCVLTNIWSITGHNDSTSKQIHDRSQATTIPLADKYMTIHRPQQFNNHTNTWSVMYLCACWIVVASDLSYMCVFVESLWPVNGHVFVC